MAAVLVTAIHEHLGTAAEKAAMSTTGLPAGSTWIETDTSIKYKWDGTSWNIV